MAVDPDIRELEDGWFGVNPTSDVHARAALFAYAQSLEESRADDQLAQKLKDLAGRMGTPPDRLGGYFVQYQNDETRHAILFFIFPPVVLRNAPRAAIQEVIRASGAGILRGIEDEIWRTYTSEPQSAANVRSIADNLSKFADTLAAREKR